MNQGAFLSIRFNRLIRLPTLVAGVGLMAKVGFEVFRAINGEPSDPSTGSYFLSSLAFLGIASSQYLKDRNRRLPEGKRSRPVEKLSRLRARLGTEGAFSHTYDALHL